MKSKKKLCSWQNQIRKVYSVACHWYKTLDCINDSSEKQKREMRNIQRFRTTFWLRRCREAYVCNVPKLLLNEPHHIDKIPQWIMWSGSFNIILMAASKTHYKYLMNWIGNSHPPSRWSLKFHTRLRFSISIRI